MTDDPMYRRTAHELASDQESGRVTAVDLVESAWARMDAYDQAAPALNAILVRDGNARATAAELDRERAAGTVRGPLHGVPIVIKDNIHVSGLPTTAGSAALAAWVPSQDAEIVKRLKAAGAVVIAKTNLHELAAGITTIGSAGGQSRNPFDPARTPGGSSGGTAASIAASFCPLGLGTDTCGSIRIPAAHCGLFGLRPTQGLSPMAGIVPLSSSQDVVGPLARSARGLADGLDVVLGKTFLQARKGAADATAPFRRAVLEARVDGLKIGVVEHRFSRSSSPARSASKVIAAALDVLSDAGAEIVPVDGESLDEWLADTSMIKHEFKFDLEEFLRGFPEAPLKSLDEVIESGLYHRALHTRFRTRAQPVARDTPEARRVLERRRKLYLNLLGLMDRYSVDALAYPASRLPAPRIGEPPAGSNASLAAHTGLPAICIPVGLSSAGLPVGLELLGRRLADDVLVGLAGAFERVLKRLPGPAAVPALKAGRPPAPHQWSVDAERDGLQFRASFTFEPRTSTLQYSWAVSGVSADDCRGLLLSQGGPETTGPVLHRLTAAGSTSGNGRVTLDGAERRWLSRSRMVLRLLTSDHPLGAIWCQVRDPSVEQGRQQG